MPISSQTPIIGYVANGVTKSFAFPFVVLSADDLKVKVGADVVTAGFSITGVGDRDGGSVTFAEAPASLTPIILYREVTLDRAIDYQENGDLLAVVLDDDFDRIWMAMQDQSVLASRVLRSPIGETLPQLPAASERALSALAFDEEGNPIVVRGTDGNVTVFVRDLASTAAGKGAGLVGFKQSGTGSVDRTADDKLTEVLSVKDFGASSSTPSFTSAISAANGRVVSVPEANNDTPLPADYSSSLIEYNGDRPIRTTHVSTIAGTAKKALKAQFKAGHADTLWSALHIEGQSQGSGKNGPSSADYGQTIAIHKSGYAGAIDPPAGEIDGLSIFVRQDGPKGQPSGGANSSDASGILVNIQNVEDVGFTSAWESSTSNYNRGTSSTTRAIQTQIGAIDANQVGAPSYGYVAVATIGVNTSAFYAGSDSGAGASWTNILQVPGALNIDGSGNYRATTTDWTGGAWSVVRSSGPNGSTQITHRGTGALFLYAQDAGAIQFGTNGAIRWQINSGGNLTPITNGVGDIGGSAVRVSQVWLNQIDIGSTGSNGVKILAGSGTPEGVVAATVGSLYLRRDGGAGTTLYVKQTGTGNTGWAAK